MTPQSESPCLIVQIFFSSHRIANTFVYHFNSNGLSHTDPFMPKGISRPYHFDESISNLRVVGW